MTEFWCDIACVPCRRAKECHKLTEPVKHGNGPWYPSQARENVPLPCGCKGIDWFVWHVLGEDVISIDCDIHGPQKLSKNWREKTRSASKKALKDYEKRCALAAMKSLEELMISDPPPF